MSEVDDVQGRGCSSVASLAASMLLLRCVASLACCAREARCGLGRPDGDQLD